MIQIEKYLNNCINVEKIDGFYRPVRFDATQIERYLQMQEKDPYVFEYQYTTGICLEMETDANVIRFSYRSYFCNHSFANFDIFVDGIFQESKEFDINLMQVYNFEYKINKNGLKQIVIYFPHTAAIELKDLEIEDGCKIIPQERTEYMLCLGDSITQGAMSLHPRLTYPVQVSRKLGIGLLNQGVSGFFYYPSTLKVDFKQKPKLITVALGTNDWDCWDSLKEIEKNIYEYFETLHNFYSEIPIYVITPIWRTDYESKKKAGTFFDIIHLIRQTVNSYTNIILVDGLNLVPHKTSLLGDECLHPNEDGFRYYSENLYKYISEKDGWIEDENWN